MKESKEVALSFVTFMFAAWGALSSWNALLNCVYSVTTLIYPSQKALNVQLTSTSTTTSMLFTFCMMFKGGSWTWMIPVAGAVNVVGLLGVPVVCAFSMADVAQWLLTGLTIVNASCCTLIEATAWSYASILPRQQCGAISFGLGLSGLYSFGVWILLSLCFPRTKLGTQRALWLHYAFAAVPTILGGSLFLCLRVQPVFRQAAQKALTQCNCPDAIKRGTCGGTTSFVVALEPKDPDWGNGEPTAETKPNGMIEDVDVEQQQQQQEQEKRMGRRVSSAREEKRLETGKKTQRMTQRDEPDIRALPEKSRVSLNSTPTGTGASSQPSTVGTPDAHEADSSAANERGAVNSQGEEVVQRVRRSSPLEKSMRAEDNSSASRKVESVPTTASIAELELGALSVFGQAGVQVLNVAVTQFSTLLVFPNIGPLAWGRSVKETDVLMGICQISDVAGRFLPNVWSCGVDPDSLIILVLLRLFLVPIAILILMCPKIDLFQHFVAQLVYLVCFHLSSGLLTTLGLMFIPQTVQLESQKSKAARMGLFAMLVAISSGTWASWSILALSR